MRIQFVDFVQFLVQYMFFLLSASVHESAHAWSAYKLGDPTAKLQNRISLNPANHIDIVGTVIIPFLVFISGVPIIGWAKPTPVNPQNFSNPRRGNMLVAGAGPVSNFLTVVLLAILWHASFFVAQGGGAKIGILFCYVFGMGIMINLMLGVFNLLPIHPLDGSGVMEGLLPEPLHALYAKMRPYGFIILLLLFYLTGLSSWIWRIILRVASWMNVQPFGLDQIW